MIEKKQIKTLYEITGDIKDINTLLINRVELRDLVEGFMDINLGMADKVIMASKWNQDIKTRS